MSHAHLSPHDAARSIALRLREAGHIAYFAGGCVRDQLLGIEPADFDVATSAKPAEITALFKGAKGVGESFGVMLVRTGGVVVEVATFRADGPYTDSRRPDSVRFATPEEDAHRRDFTVNGLFMDPASGEVIDFVGGRADVAARVLRAIGSPHERIREDRLRMLRAARFAARFALEIEPQTVDAIRAHASELAGVSRERIGIEIRKIVEHPRRVHGAELVESLGLDAAVFAEPHTTGQLARLSAIEHGRPVGALLAAWLRDRGERGGGTGRWTEALMLSNRESSDLETTLGLVAWMLDGFDGSPIADRRLTLASPLTPSALDIVEVEAPERARSISEWMAPYAAAPGGLAPARWVNGGDLIAAGLRPGPAMGAILDRVYRAQLEGQVGDAPAALAQAVEWGRNGS
ncbi:MAG: CCA tRNA nucleotidyltransferase [Bacteroidia bacterium]|nr:CCA tRNA nucleotidyltransferase [Bacteroidia bacterium]